MAALQSYANTAANVVSNALTRTITIDNEVVEIDGALDTIPGGWRIICQNAGGLRCAAGSSGTWGGLAIPLFVIETETAHRFGTDSYNGSNGRFVGGSCKLSNVVWRTHCRSTGNLSNSRSDFDVSSGFAGEFNGLRHLATKGDGGSADPIQCFTHLASSSLKLTRNAYTGYSIWFENTENPAVIEFVRAPAVAEADMILVDSHPSNTTNAHVAFRLDHVGAGGVMELAGLRGVRSWATINSSQDYSDRSVRITDPEGLPPRLAWSGQYDGNIEVRRTQYFDFGGVAVPANTQIHAIATASGGVNATGTAAGATGSVACRTQYNDDGDADYAVVNTYRFHMTGYPFRKFYSGATARTIANDPARIDVALVQDQLPDGTAVTAMTTGNVSTAAELYRALKTYAVANYTEPSAAASLVQINSSGHIVLGTGAQLRLTTSQTDLVAETSNGIYSVRAASAGVSASNGITLVDVGTTNALNSGTIELLEMPYRDSGGTSSLVNVSASANEKVLLFTSTGQPLRDHSYDADGSHAFVLTPTESAAGVRLAHVRTGGYIFASRTLDLSAGGVFSVSLPPLVQELDRFGAVIYDADADTTGFGSTSYTLNASLIKLGIGNEKVSVDQLYKAYADFVATDHGARFAAFDRTPLRISKSAFAGNEVILGANITLRRAASGNNDAGVLAAVFGTLDHSRGQVIAAPGLNDSQVQALVWDASDATSLSTSVASVLANTSVIIDQLEHVATSLPLIFPAGSPLTPLAIMAGLAGMEGLYDSEETDYPITGTNVATDPDAKGIYTLAGAGSYIDIGLNRGTSDEPDLYTDEIISLVQYRPSAFNATQPQALYTLGAMVVYVAPSTGNTAQLRIGAHNSQQALTTATIDLNAWNDICFSIEQTDRANYPIVRVSVNGATQQKFNASTDEIWGQVASNTQNFRIGNGAVGDVRAMCIHPNNEIHADGAGYDFVAGISWNSYYQVWTGANLMTRTAGIAIDHIEKVANDTLALATDIDTKILDAETLAAAVWTRTDALEASATGNYGQMIKHLAANAYTGTPPTKEEIATAARDIGLSGAAANSIGAKIAALQNVDQAALVLLIWGHAIETGLSAERAFQALLASGVGSSSKSGSQWTLNRLDASATAIVQGDVDDEGQRSNVRILDDDA